MPVRAGTLAEARTQVDLRCDYCGHELSIEMTPPVLIVNPARHTDSSALAGDEPPIDLEGNPREQRRSLPAATPKRMRVGLRGLLVSADGTHTVAVLYSLDGHQSRGRMRPLDPSSQFPSWLHPDDRLKLQGYDGLPLDIRVTAVKIPLQDWKDDDHFAEFVVRPLTP